MNDHQPFILYADSYSGARNTPLHFHTGAELVYIASGRCLTQGQDGDFQADAGQLFIIPAEFKHRQIDSGKVVKYYAVFEMPNAKFPTTMRVLDTSRDKFIGIWMEQISRLYAQQQLNECNLLLQLLLCHLNDLEHKLGGDNQMPAKLRSALDFMLLHFVEKISLGNVAAKYSYSTSHFNALFHRHLKQSPSEFLQRLRMTEARRLLLHDDKSVKEISEECGYRTSHYFCRHFRKVHGCTPKDFRRARPHWKTMIMEKDNALLFNSWYNNRKK